jgi:hypothetical protein
MNEITKYKAISSNVKEKPVNLKYKPIKATFIDQF